MEDLSLDFSKKSFVLDNFQTKKEGSFSSGIFMNNFNNEKKRNINNIMIHKSGNNQKQAKDWLQILETLGIIFYLHPYSNNLLKRLVKTPKLYFYDTGLVCYLTRWSSAEVLESGAMNGAALENYVVSEIAKTYMNFGREPYMYYYRDKDAKEIDVILEHDGIINPIEIKKTSNPGTELTKVFKLLDKASAPRGKGAIVCMKPKVGVIDRDNYVVPIWVI